MNGPVHPEVLFGDCCSTLPALDVGHDVNAELCGFHYSIANRGVHTVSISVDISWRLLRILSHGMA
jgi:hypothetical protein